MMITDVLWARIREQFTEQEKEVLRTAMVGETICPRGIVIDSARLDAGLVSRLEGAKAEAHR